MMEKKNLEMKTNTLFVQDHSEEILKLIRSQATPARLVKDLKEFHERDIARVFPALTAKERKRLYLILDKSVLADILEHCEQANTFLQELNFSTQAMILSQMEIQDVQDYLWQLSRENKQTLLDLMDESIRREISLIDSFDEEEIGSRMSTNYIKISSDLTVRQAMKQLIEQAAHHDNISTIYVIDENGVLSGAIDLKALIVAREGEALEDIVMSSYPYVYANELIEDCIERLRNYSEDSIPVLDRDNRLRGVLTANDIAQIADDEISEDYARLAGLSSQEDLHESLLQSVKKRLPWLMVLMALGLVVSSVVGLFESVIAQLTIIISFQSLILDMAGNVGTQSLAVTIRVLMDEQVSTRDKLSLVLKEARVGLINGILLGIISIVFISGYLFLLKGQSLSFSFAVALCIAVALIVSILFSGICGTTIPMLFQKLKVDPAVASGPLITTLNDLIAVVTYYGLAWLILIKALGL